jgi:hypothetical protein
MKQPIDSNGKGFQAIYPGATQKISFTGTASSSTAFLSASDSQGSGMVEIFATTDCWILFGTSPTATASAGTSVFIPAGLTRYYAYKSGEKLSVIRSTTSGDLHITQAG